MAKQGKNLRKAYEAIDRMTDYELPEAVSYTHLTLPTIYSV